MDTAPFETELGEPLLPLWEKVGIRGVAARDASEWGGGDADGALPLTQLRLSSLRPLSLRIPLPQGEREKENGVSA